MQLELLHNVNVQDGLKELVDLAYSMKQNLDARIETPILKDETDLWKTWLDSKTLNLYGGVNQDKRHRFKIDHAFDLSRIVYSDINPDGSIPTGEDTYMQSQGTEFIIINKADVKGAEADYAIQDNKYESIREQLNKGRYEIKDLEKVGGFKINVHLKHDEIAMHDGWRELAVGKNNASEEDYAKASQFLKEKYVPEAENKKCFSGGTAMGFFVRTNESDYKARPRFLGGSNGRSGADGRGGFGLDARFLRVRAGCRRRQKNLPQEAYSPQEAYEVLIGNPAGASRTLRENPDYLAPLLQIITDSCKQQR